MHHAVELGALLLGLLDTVADHDEGTGENFQVLGVAADLFHPALDVGIEFLAVGEGAAAGEHGLRGFRRKLLAVLGRAGLHDQRPALDRAGDVERAAHAEILSLVIEHVHLGGIEIQALFDIAHKSVVGEGIPQPGDDVIEFTRALVAFGVLHMVVEPEIQRGVGIGSGDDIPPRAAAGNMIERGEAAGDVIGLVERGRSGRDQADMFGGACQRRQQRERLERGHGVAALERVDRHVQHGQMVGHEEGVELSGLEFLDQLLDMREIEVGVGPGARITPRAGVDRDRPHECAELELPFRHLPHSVFVIVDKEIGNESSNAIGRREKNFAISASLKA